MPRTSDTRPPAEPSSAGQKVRYQRILEVAAQLGTEQDFEHVQMQDVAAGSEVAIATLYRYFPSKVHLYVAVMKSQLEQVEPSWFTVEPGQDRADFTADLLMQFTRRMARNRQLSMSMMQSIILAPTLHTRGSDEIATKFLELLLEIAGWGKKPTEDQRRRCWLVIQCWFGVLVTTLSGDHPVETADIDIRRACHLLLGETPDLGDGVPTR